MKLKHSESLIDIHNKKERDTHECLRLVVPFARQAAKPLPLRRLAVHVWQSAAGQNVNKFTAMQTLAVYACVRLLVESIAGLSLHVYEYRGTGKERVPEHPLYLWVVTQCRINSSNSIRQTSHLPAFMRD